MYLYTNILILQMLVLNAKLYTTASSQVLYVSRVLDESLSMFENPRSTYSIIFKPLKQRKTLYNLVY